MLSLLADGAWSMLVHKALQMLRNGRAGAPDRDAEGLPAQTLCRKVDRVLQHPW
jgi:hypothetical protein